MAGAVDVRSASEPAIGPSSGGPPLATAEASWAEKTARLDWSSSVTANASASPELLERCCASNTIDSTGYGPVDNRLFNASKATLLTWASLSCFIWLQMPGSNIHSGISSAGELFISSCPQRRTLLPPRRASPRTNAPCPNHGCQRYCTSRMQVLWVSCTPVVQHRQTALFAGVQTSSFRSTADLNQQGAWRNGNRSALPTSPHPRRRLSSNIDNCATLTSHWHKTSGKAGLRCGLRSKLGTGEGAARASPARSVWDEFCCMGNENAKVQLEPRHCIGNVTSHDLQGFS